MWVLIVPICLAKVDAIYLETPNSPNISPKFRSLVLNDLDVQVWCDWSLTKSMFLHPAPTLRARRDLFAASHFIVNVCCTFSAVADLANRRPVFSPHQRYQDRSTFKYYFCHPQSRPHEAHACCRINDRSGTKEIGRRKEHKGSCVVSAMGALTYDVWVLVS